MATTEGKKRGRKPVGESEVYRGFCAGVQDLQDKSDSFRNAEHLARLVAQTIVERTCERPIQLTVTGAHGVVLHGYVDDMGRPRIKVVDEVMSGRIHCLLVDARGEAVHIEMDAADPSHHAPLAEASHTS